MSEPHQPERDQAIAALVEEETVGLRSPEYGRIVRLYVERRLEE